MHRRTFLGTAASVVALSTIGPFVRRARADTIKLVGASQFNEDHPFTKAMRKFEALVKERSTEQPVSSSSTSTRSSASRRIIFPT